MRIGITCYPTFGGSGTVAANLGRMLALRGHEVHFITSALPYKLKYHSYPNLFFHEVERVSYPLFEDNSPYVLLLASKMAEISETHRLDLLHVHYAIPHAVAALTARDMLKRKPKIITTLHGTDVTLIGALSMFKELTAYSIEKSDGVTAVSHYLKRETESAFNTRKAIRVIHNFIDRAEFNPRIKKCLCLRKKSRDETVILHISNFRKVKRIPDVIRVFKGIADAMPARLFLVGEGPESCAARALVKELKLTDKVEFLGLIYNVAPVIVHADLLLQVSDVESFGLTSLEALASGVPVIGTGGSGVAEVVEDGKNGCLSAPGDTDKMIADALSILTDGKRRAAFSRHGAKWAVDRFSADRIVPQYEKFYKEVMKA